MVDGVNDMVVGTVMVCGEAGVEVVEEPLTAFLRLWGYVGVLRGTGLGERATGGILVGD